MRTIKTYSKGAPFYNASDPRKLALYQLIGNRSPCGVLFRLAKCVDWLYMRVLVCAP